MAEHHPQTCGYKSILIIPLVRKPDPSYGGRRSVGWNSGRISVAVLVLMIGPYATKAGELRQDRKVAAVSHVLRVPWDAWLEPVRQPN